MNYLEAKLQELNDVLESKKKDFCFHAEICNCVDMEIEKVEEKIEKRKKQLNVLNAFNSLLDLEGDLFWELLIDDDHFNDITFYAGKYDLHLDGVLADVFTSYDLVVADLQVNGIGNKVFVSILFAL